MTRRPATTCHATLPLLRRRLRVLVEQRRLDIVAGEAELLRLVECVVCPAHGDRVGGHGRAGYSRLQSLSCGLAPPFACRRRAHRQLAVRALQPTVVPERSRQVSWISLFGQLLWLIAPLDSH